MMKFIVIVKTNLCAALKLATQPNDSDTKNGSSYRNRRNEENLPKVFANTVNAAAMIKSILGFSEVLCDFFFLVFSSRFEGRFKENARAITYDTI